MNPERKGFIFARVGVRIAHHPRFLRIEDRDLRAAALGVWTAALTYSRAEQIDGFCPLNELHTIASPETIDRLVAVGLFTRDVQDGVHGVWVLKYAEFNDTKEQIDASREWERQRKRKAREEGPQARPKVVRRKSAGSPKGQPPDSHRKSAGSPSSSSSSGSPSSSDLLDPRINPPAQPPQDLLDAREPERPSAGVLDSSNAKSETRIRSTLTPLPGPMGQAEIERRRADQLRALAALDSAPASGAKS